MKLSDIDPKKRYNIFLSQPHKGLGDPGQLGIYDITGEKLIKAVKEGARVERVTKTNFQLKGVRSKSKRTKQARDWLKKRRR